MKNIIIVFALFLTACAVGPNYHRPVVPIPENFRAPAPLPAPKGRKAKRAEQAKAAQAVPTAPTPPPVERVKQEVNSNLESLKDTLLRLELRRQAGTITDTEYALERGRAEQLLRDLVQG